MANGDLKAALGALGQSLRAVKCPHPPGASTEELLPALSFVLLGFSRHIALLVSQSGLQLHGASDQRFVEGALKFVREGLGLKPPLSAAQFLSPGFAQRKVQLVCDVARRCRELHNAAARQERLAALKACHAEQRLYVASAYAAPAAAAAAAQGPVKPSSSAIPKPPPHVRVVGGCQQLLAQAAASAAAGLQAGGAGEDLSSEGSESGAGATPTSVLAAAAVASSRAGAQEPAARKAEQPAAMDSPADQPRPLPPSLVPARPQESRGQCLPLLLQQLPAFGLQMPPAAQHPGPVQQPNAALTQQQPQQQLVAPQQPLQQQQQQSVAPLHPPQQQQVALWQQAGAGGGPLEEQRTRRLIEDLQLRLGLAEEAAAAARQEAQLAREQLQARVTILEGRVRFLEAGYELQPPQLLQCAAHQGQPPAQPLALTWGPGGSSPARGGVPAAHSPPVAAWGGQAGGQVAAAGGTAAWLQQTTPLQLQDSQPHAHSNPLFDSQPSFAASRQQPAAMAAGAAAAPAPAASWGAAAGTAAAITAHQLQPVAAATVAPPPAAVVPAPAPAQRGYSSAAELISSMQARFSEADDFLLSLRRL